MAAQTPHRPHHPRRHRGKFRELEGERASQVDVGPVDASSPAVVAAVARVLLAFLLGSRKGRKRSTVVEIRRV